MRPTMETPRQVRELLLLFSSILVVGCTSGSNLVGVRSPSQGSAISQPPLPKSDSGLSEHVPEEVVIGFLPSAEVQKVVDVTSGKVLREIKQLNAVIIG